MIVLGATVGIPQELCFILSSLVCPLKVRILTMDTEGDASNHMQRLLQLGRNKYIPLLSGL